MAASGPSRSNGVSKRGAVSRAPPPSSRPAFNRAQTATPTLHSRAAASESFLTRHKSPKRKAQEHDNDIDLSVEETNINVVVRCRGRNDREVRENSAVVVSSDGIKGKKVELSMGPHALTNKAYQFDKVFSPAADQGMIFEEVVTPILDSLLAGLNCTIFAYGQTGTGKTYTMSGDISDMLPIPEAAGIIPRVLHTLFNKLNQDESEQMDTTVKCSFIELYNEELRDLLAYEQNTKLKIFDDTNKNGRNTTLVQGMEETYVETASKGIQLLRSGSHKRQVAATRCNDLSSRSHTVFTVTVCTKRVGESGEEHIQASKLNLVDLAGSENIQRSGAEAQRATEAGLINKSLLTLGRVINSLVDRNSHIPYRESKLTRLLQDSLGGRTKTCIIATLSPAKSNLEETISTLDYAFRAKNIRNKPQTNSLISKKIWLREYTAEIEKLKSELIATRHRNGFYLTAEAYEELTTESESRRILSEEQRDKIETMDSNLRNKVQELYALTINLQTSKKENEKLQGRLHNSRDILDKTEILLAHTKKSLTEQTTLRKAHEATEEKLVAMHSEIRQTIDVAETHARLLHQKIQRKEQMQEQNQTSWEQVKATLVGSGRAIEESLLATRDRQSVLVSTLAETVSKFVHEEMDILSASHNALQNQQKSFDCSLAKMSQNEQVREQMADEILAEAHTLRSDIKDGFGGALRELSDAAQRIGTGIANELCTFQARMETSHNEVVRHLEASFGDLAQRMQNQQEELEALREQNTHARESFLASTEDTITALTQSITEEERAAKAEREQLTASIARLLEENASRQAKRLRVHVESTNKRIKLSDSQWQTTQQAFENKLTVRSDEAATIQKACLQHASSLHTELEAQWNTGRTQIGGVTTTSQSIHEGTTETIEAQMLRLDEQLSSLHHITKKIEAQGTEHRQRQATCIAEATRFVHDGVSDVTEHLTGSRGRTDQLAKLLAEHQADLQEDVTDVLSTNGEPSRLLRSMLEASTAFGLLHDQPSGETPDKTAYRYPNMVPRTEAHEVILDRSRGARNLACSPTKSPRKHSPAKRSPSKIPTSPSKTSIFSDATTELPVAGPITQQAVHSPKRAQTTLQELDINVISMSTLDKNDSKVTLQDPSGETGTAAGTNKQAIRSSASDRSDSKVGKVKQHRTTGAILGEGRENAMPGPISFNANLGASQHRRLRNRAVE